MKRLVLALCLILAASSVYAQKKNPFISYYEYTPFMQASEGAFRYGLNGFINPAMLGMADRSETLLMMSTIPEDTKHYNYGIFSGAKGFGTGLMRFDYNGKSFWDYSIGTGFGNRTFSMGFSWGIIGGDNPNGYKHNYRIGAMYRPIPYLSLGYVMRSAFNGDNLEQVAEIGVRPIKNYPLTLYADLMGHSLDDYKEVAWSAGLSWEVLRGIRLNGRYLSDERLSVGIDLSIGNGGYGAMTTAPKSDNFDDATHTLVVRLSPPDRSILDDLFAKKNKQVLKMELAGTLSAPEGLFAMFSGDDYLSLTDVLKRLDDLKDDKEVTALVLNITKLSADYESIWEIREKLAELKTSGKKVIIYSENYSMRDYHLASVADKIVIEPMGMVSLEGFAMGRSYYKDFMDKYGIGFEEIRLFKYKSAVESYTRRSFSEGDREQRQSLVDDFYNFAKKEISSSRKLSDEEFEKIVNTDLIILADHAKEKKLIDYTQRWNQIDTLIKSWQSDAIISDAGWFRMDLTPRDDRWSEQGRKVAIVYAEGACDMETGIKGRALSQIMESVMTNDNYEAVVLRVNSPGGSALASDYVADVIRRHKGKKPVIVSQAAVAASGGYWLSMDADTILAAPMTITGSIGVIAGWMYNKGLMDSLGVTYDLVKKGAHSDLGMPVVLPFLPVGLPARTLTESERKNFENMISYHYADFVNKVAKGRDTDSAKIGEVAQGRVYSGLKGKELGLVDEIGGFAKAIEIVKDKINFRKDDELEVYEFRPATDFNIGSLFASVKSVFTNKTSEKELMLKMIEEDVKMRMENNGKPLYILPNDYYNILK